MRVIHVNCGQVLQQHRDFWLCWYCKRAVAEHERKEA